MASVFFEKMESFLFSGQHGFRRDPISKSAGDQARIAPGAMRMAA
jgi:hypothetical protein